MYGLIIKKKWLDLIMSGQKTLEIRGSRTSHAGEEIALLESGSQKIRGFCTIKEVTALDKGKWEAHRDAIAWMCRGKILLNDIRRHMRGTYLQSHQRRNLHMSIQRVP